MNSIKGMFVLMAKGFSVFIYFSLDIFVLSFFFKESVVMVVISFFLILCVGLGGRKRKILFFIFLFMH